MNIGDKVKTLFDCVYAGRAEVFDYTNKCWTPGNTAVKIGVDEIGVLVDTVVRPGYSRGVCFIVKFQEGFTTMADYELKKAT